MTTQELANYIVEQIKSGLTFEDIKKSLLEAGWDEKSIDEAQKEAGAPSSVRAYEEDMMEGFFPPPPYKRVVKRFAVLLIGAGAAGLLIYVLTR